MTDGAEKNTLRLSPVVRVSMSLGLEMNLDRQGLFDKERYQAYLKMFQVAENKRDIQLKAVFVLDALSVLLALGKSIQIPGFGLAVQELPAALEIVTLAASFSFVFYAFAFVNWLSYNMIIDQFNIRKVGNTGIDPEFLGASDKFTEFFLKVFRVKFNIWGPDFYLPGAGFKALSLFVSAMVRFVIFSMLAVHVAAIGISLHASFFRLESPLRYGYVVLVCLINFCAVLILVMQNSGFKFTIWDRLLEPATSPSGTSSPGALPAPQSDQAALYFMKYIGRASSGQAVLYIGNGSIAGVDIGGGRYNGRYVEENGRMRGECALRFPNGGYLVTGEQVAPGTKFKIPFDWNSNFATGDPQEISISGAQIVISFERAGEIA